MRVFVAQLNPIVGDLKGNSLKIIEAIRRSGEEIVLFPEMAITGYPPQDLLLYSDFIRETELMLKMVARETKGKMVVVGTVRVNQSGKEKGLYNSAAVIQDGKIAGYKDKTLLPTYDIFDERRYFEPGKEQKVFLWKGKKIGILICEDIWEHSGKLEYTSYARDPVEELKRLKPDLVLNLSASPYYFQKKDLRKDIFLKAAKSLGAPLVVCNQVGGNDGLVFDGYSMGITRGKVCYAKGFEEDDFRVDTVKFKSGAKPLKPVEDLFSALVLAVRDYFGKQGLKKAVLGLSGGIDSSLALCILEKALGRKNLLALSMPSRYTSLASIEDARLLCKKLGVELWDIPIDGMFQRFLDLMAPVFKGKERDATEENLQSRIRGIVLMAVSNKLGYVVISTGNKSEMATGYCTLYGDMAGGLAILGDVSKRQIYELARFVNKKKIIPKRVLTRAPSAELKENQTDQDTLPGYEIVDAVLEGYVERHLPDKIIAREEKIPLKEVKELIRRIHKAEYKRRQSAPGIKVTKRAFTLGRMLPIVQGWVK